MKRAICLIISILVSFSFSDVIFSGFSGHYSSPRHQSHVAAVKAKDSIVGAYGGYWYMYMDATGSVTDVDGTPITTTTVSSLVQPDGILHVGLTTTAAAETYAGVGCPMIGGGTAQVMLSTCHL